MRNFNESDYFEDLFYGPEKDYFDEISEIENGGYDEYFETEGLKNPYLAAEIHKAAQKAGLSDLDYVNQQEFFDEIIDSDPQDGPHIVDIEEREGYSEFIYDDEGNPNLEDARPIYNNLVSGAEKGFYGRNCKDNPIEALEDVIEGCDTMVSDAMLGRNTLKGALNLLAKYKDNPNCPKCKKHFDALSNYAEQINKIANEIGATDLIIDIPGNSEDDDWDAEHSINECNESDCSDEDCADKSCKKKSKKDKLDEISEEGLAKIVVAYKSSDPDKKPLEDNQGEVYAVAYDEDLSDKQNIDKLKRFLRQKGISEPAILKLRFKKMTA